MFLYEIGVGRGSGMDFESKVIRIWWWDALETSDSETAYGLSFYQRNNAMGQERWRVGLDGQHYIGPLGLLGEISGKSGDLPGIDRSAPFLAYTQYRWQYKYLTLGGWKQCRLGSALSAGPSDNENIRDLTPARTCSVFKLDHENIPFEVHPVHLFFCFSMASGTSRLRLTLDPYAVIQLTLGLSFLHARFL